MFKGPNSLTKNEGIKIISASRKYFHICSVADVILRFGAQPLPKFV